MLYENITNPKIKDIIDSLKYYSMSTETYVLQALEEANNEEEFITNAQSEMDSLCDETKDLNQSLTEADNEITIYVEGGVIQDITGIPEDISVKVVDRDVDGIEENSLTKLESGMALVSVWKPDCSSECVKPA